MKNAGEKTLRSSEDCSGATTLRIVAVILLLHLIVSCALSLAKFQRDFEQACTVRASHGWNNKSEAGTRIEPEHHW